MKFNQQHPPEVYLASVKLNKRGDNFLSFTSLFIVNVERNDYYKHLPLTSLPWHTVAHSVHYISKLKVV